MVIRMFPNISQSQRRPLLTLSIFGTKCEGKFVPDDCTIHVATEHVQCTGMGWWESWDTDWQLVYRGKYCSNICFNENKKSQVILGDPESLFQYFPMKIFMFQDLKSYYWKFSTDVTATQFFRKIYIWKINTSQNNYRQPSDCGMVTGWSQFKPSPYSVGHSHTNFTIFQCEW